MRRFTRAALTVAALAAPVALLNAQADWRKAALDSFDDAWQTVADTFFDPAFGGVDWNAVRAALRPEVEAADSPETARVAIRTMLAQLHQSHFALLSASAADNGSRVEPAPPANRPVGPATSVTIGNLPPLSVRTDVRELHTPTGRRVGLIAFNYWMTSIDGPVADAVDRFRSASGMVLDLRGNPGGLAAMMSGIAGHFIADEGALLGRMQMRDLKLEFHPNPRRATTDGRRVEPFAGPLALLVDEHDRQHVGVFCGRDAEPGTCARVRPEDDGAGSAGDDEEARQRRRAHVRRRHVRDEHGPGTRTGWRGAR